MNYQYLLTHRELFPAAIGITYSQFELLLPKFEAALYQAEHQRAYSKPRVRAPGGGRKSTLKTNRQKLFFILLYYKTYPTFRFAQVLFGFDKRNIQLWVRLLESVLFQALGYQLQLPQVRVKCFSHWLEVCPDLQEFIVDASERCIQRPKNVARQEFYYSGKKKCHTVKNQILVSPGNKRILAVSATVEGKRHDKNLFEHDPLLLKLPPDSIGMGDTAYQGTSKTFHPWLTVVIPKKKPPGSELTLEEKANNRVISQVRVRSEHPFSYLKHFNILSHKFRNRLQHSHQPFLTLACLYNFTRTNR